MYIYHKVYILLRICSAMKLHKIYKEDSHLIIMKIRRYAVDCCNDRTAYFYNGF